MSASNSLDSSLNTLKKLDANEIRIVCETLIKILSRIRDKPYDVAARLVPLESDDVLYNLMPYEGALEILFDIGFEEVILLKNKLEEMLINKNYFLILKNNKPLYYRTMTALSCPQL